jgi:hypothetical protein
VHEPFNTTSPSGLEQISGAAYDPSSVSQAQVNHYFGITYHISQRVRVKEVTHTELNRQASYSGRVLNIMNQSSDILRASLHESFADPSPDESGCATHENRLIEKTHFNLFSAYAD